MKNLKGDFLWAGLLLIWVLILVIPVLRTQFIQITDAHPYLGGFVKFAILASMGDMLGARILKGRWVFPTGFLFKAIVWGILGMMITLVFTVFMSGAAGAQAAGRLPFQGSKLAQAFWGSMIMNLTFGPMLYIYHRFGDLFVDLMLEKRKGTYNGRITVKEMVSRVDWYTIVSFSWLKTCLFVWIPCHTIVFLLVPEYRVLASAFLSILLGIIIAFSKKSTQKVS
ncbi:MAG: Mpv17/PMP22 family protein [Vallitaleaceae bacterium]|nr:Mpv17/PMP22 family protein [Vallitaleaceae bacterium]